jgi:type I restriction enzyme, S subunit
MNETPLKRYRLNEVIRQFMDFRGRTPLKLGMEWGGGDICALSANNVQMGRIDFSKEGYLGSEALYRCWMTKGDCKKGDILLTTEAPLGNVAQIPDDSKYILSQRTILLKVDNSSVFSDYLFHLFQSESFQSDLVRHSTGSTVVGIQQTKLAKIEIQLPTLAKQKKIAEILSTIDQTIAHTEALIQKYQQIKAGLMHDLFTRGITSDGQLRPPREQAPELYKDSAIGWIPREWEAKKLENILAESGGYLQTGPFGSQLHAYEYTFEGVPVVMPQDINDGKISVAQITRIPEKRAEILHRHRLKIGDIIISRRGELSRAATITEIEKTWICGTGCFLLRLGGSTLDARFFSLAYRHDLVQRQVSGLAVGTTMPSLNNSVMSALYFPHINIDEQNRISSRIEIVEQEIETLNGQRRKLNKQKSGLMHDLLTGKVPVTLSES